MKELADDVRVSDAKDCVWRLKSEAVGEFPIGRRVPSLGLFNEGPAETFFQHAIPIRLLAQQHSSPTTSPVIMLINSKMRYARHASRRRG